MARPRKSETIGGPSPRGLELELRRALRPMLASVQRAATGVRTPAHARALGAALRKAWPDKRIAAVVRGVMARAEQRASAGWGKWERKVAHRVDSTRTRMDAKYRGNIGDYATWSDLRGQVARSISSKYDNVRKVTVIEWELADGSRLTTIGLPKGITRADPWPKLTPYDGNKLVDKWTREAAKKITSVRDEVAEGMRRDVVAALEAGTDPAELAAKWRAQGIPTEFGTLEGRVKTIAQHQIANLHAAVQSERARAIGATEFVWMTQEDDKVRAAHRALHGRTFSYESPPEEGLPGTPVNCRCFQEVVVPDELTFEVGAAFDS